MVSLNAEGNRCKDSQKATGVAHSNHGEMEDCLLPEGPVQRDRFDGRRRNAREQRRWRYLVAVAVDARKQEQNLQSRRYAEDKKKKVKPTVQLDVYLLEGVVTRRNRKTFPVTFGMLMGRRRRLESDTKTLRKRCRNCDGVCTRECRFIRIPLCEALNMFNTYKFSWLKEAIDSYTESAEVPWHVENLGDTPQFVCDSLNPLDHDWVRSLNALVFWVGMNTHWVATVCKRRRVEYDLDRGYCYLRAFPRVLWPVAAAYFGSNPECSRFDDASVYKLSALNVLQDIGVELGVNDLADSMTQLHARWPIEWKDSYSILDLVYTKGRIGAKYEKRPKITVPRAVFEKYWDRKHRRRYPRLHSYMVSRRRLDALPPKPPGPVRGKYKCGMCGNRTDSHVCPFVTLDLQELFDFHLEREAVDLAEFFTPHEAAILMEMRGQEVNGATRAKITGNRKKKQQPTTRRKRQAVVEGTQPLTKEDIANYLSNREEGEGIHNLKAVQVQKEEENAVATLTNTLKDRLDRLQALEEKMTESETSSETQLVNEPIDIKDAVESKFWDNMMAKMGDLRDTISGELESVPSKYKDTILKYIEDIALLAYDIYYAETFRGVILALVRYVKLVTGKPISSYFFSFVEALFEDYEPVNDSQEVNGSTEVFLSKWELFTKNVMYEKIVYLVGVVIGMLTTQKDDIEWKVGNVSFLKIPIVTSAQGAFNILDAVIRVSIWMLQTGAACIETGSWDPVLYSDQTTREMNIAYDQILKYEEEMLKGKIHLGTAYKDVTEALNLYAKYKKRMSDKITLSVVDKRIAHMMTFQTTVEMKIKTAGLKAMPMAVCFQGPSQIGKSFFMNMIIPPMFTKLGIKFEEWMRAYADMSDQYDSSVQPWTRVLIADEWLNAKLQFYQEPMTDRILKWINTVPHPCNKADLESKGKVFHMYDLVCMSCNPKLMNAHAFTDHPEAVLNRVLYVEVQVKEEFRTKGNLSLATFRPEIAGQNFWDQDYWTFTINQPMVVQDASGKRVGVVPKTVTLPDGSFVHCENIDIKTFRQVYSCLVQQHVYRQALSLEKEQEIKSVKMCSKCLNIEKECMCELYKKSNPNDPALYHFHDTEKVQATYGKTLPVQPEPPKTTWNERVSRLFGRDPEIDSQAINGMYDDLVKDAVKKAAGDWFKSNFNLMLWWHKLLGYKPVAKLATKTLAHEMHRYAEDVATPWLVSKLPKDVAQSNTYKWIVGRLAHNAAWLDTKDVMRSLLFPQLTVLYCFRKTLLKDKFLLLPLMGSLVGLNVCLGNVLHNARHRAIADEWSKRSDALTVGNAKIREMSVNNGAYVIGPLIILGLKAFAAWNAAQVVNSVTTQEETTEQEEDDKDALLKQLGMIAWKSSELSNSQAQAVSTLSDDHLEPQGEDDFDAPCVFTGDVEDAARYADAIGAQKGFNFTSPQAKVDVKKSGGWFSNIFGLPALKQCNSSTATTTCGQMVESVQKSGLGHITVKLPKGPMTTCCFVVETGFVLVPRHVFLADAGGKRPVYGDKTVRAQYYPYGAFNAKVVLAGHEIKVIARIGVNAIPIEGTDAVLLRVNTPSAKNRSDWLPDTVPEGTYSCRYVNKNRTGRVSIGNVACTGCVVKDHPHITHFDGATYNSKLASGDCMTPIFADTANPFIMCFHITSAKSGSGDARGVVITRADYTAAKQKFFTANVADVPRPDSGQVPNSIMGGSVVTGDVHPLAYTPDSDRIYPLGSTYQGRTQKTQVRKTFCHDAVEKIFGPNRYKPPDIHPTSNNNHYNKGLDEIASGMKPIDSVLMNWAVEDYLSTLLEIIKKNNNKARPLTLNEVINGIDEVRFIDAINHSTSGGFNAGGRKDKHYRVREVKGKRVGVTLSKTLATELRRIKSAMQSFMRPYFVYDSCLKDEVVALSKTKVRVFQMMGLGGSMYVRKYFLPIIAFLQNNPLDAEIAVGLDCSSPNWKIVMDRVIEHLDTILAWDYSKYDKTMSEQPILAAMSVFVRLAAALGYSKNDIVAMLSLVDEFANPVSNWNRTLFMFGGTNPSGNNLTTILNSIMNALLVRCFFAEEWFKAKGELPTVQFRELIQIIFYGDDSLGCVNPNCPVRFDALKYQEWCAQYGIGITPPQKDEEMTAYLDKTKADFLKRVSNYVPEIGTEVGALEIASIYKPFYWRLNSEATDAEHILSVAATAAAEMFLHGRDKFDEFIAQLNELENEIDMFIPAAHFSFDQRVDRWLKKFA